jgi:glutathione S-transferase
MHLLRGLRDGDGPGLPELRRRARGAAEARFGGDVILHDYLPSGNGYKVRLLLTQLGIPFERIEYDVTAGETRTPQFLRRVNPNGRIPVLETDGGGSLAESDAILFYLAEGTPFLPEERLERARVLQWMFFDRNLQFSQNARA